MQKYFILSITNQSFAATLFVNDIPVFTDNLRNEMDKTVHINQYIIEGKNSFRAVLHVPSELDAIPDDSNEFYFKIEQILAESEESMTSSVVVEYLLKPNAEDSFPFIFDTSFEVSDAYGKYDWQTANQWSDESLDRSSILGYADTILKALKSKSFSELSPHLHWKRTELGRCYGFATDELENDDKELFESLFQNSNWGLEDFDPSDLVYDLWANGRIVQVIRPNGKELIRTVRLKESDIFYSLPLILAYIENEWRLVR